MCYLGNMLNPTIKHSSNSCITLCKGTVWREITFTKNQTSLTQYTTMGRETLRKFTVQENITLHVGTCRASGYNFALYTQFSRQYKSQLQLWTIAGVSLSVKSPILAMYS